MFKTFIPFNNYNKGVGGPKTFMKNLRSELDKKGFKYQLRPWLASSIFFPIAVNIKLIKRVKLFRGKVIQRLDGVYYPSKHSDKYLEFNSQTKNIYLNYADHVIFQSEYSKKQVFEMFGKMDERSYSIICNGADLDIFYPSERIVPSEMLTFITTGNFRNKDMLEPVIKALDLLANNGVVFKLKILGPITLPNKSEILLKEYVVHDQVEELESVADSLRGADIFIYSHLNPPCPNSVIEAISTGLPVVGFDSGALKEICFFNPELFAFVSDKVFQLYEEFDHIKLAEKIEKAIVDFPKYKKNALEFASIYSMSDCANNYIKAINDASR